MRMAWLEKIHNRSENLENKRGINQINQDVYIKISFYIGLFLIVLVFLVSSIYITSLFKKDNLPNEILTNTSPKEENNIKKSNQKSIDFKPVEEVKLIKEIFNETSKKGKEYCNTLKEPYKEYCYSYYYTEAAFSKSDVYECLNIPYKSKIGCVVSYSYHHNKTFCDVLDKDEDIYICKNILQNM